MKNRVYNLKYKAKGNIINEKEVNIKTGLPRYDTATNVSLLLFYVFALQCMSTLAVVRKETGHWKFAFMQFFVFTLIAYVFAFAAYQIIK